MAFVNPNGGTPVRMAEDGPIDATKYLSPALQDAGFTASFQSDVEGVPEPSTFALLGLGGLSLAAFAWKRRKQPV